MSCNICIESELIAHNVYIPTAMHYRGNVMVKLADHLWPKLGTGHPSFGCDTKTIVQVVAALQQTSEQTVSHPGSGPTTTFLCMEEGRAISNNWYTYKSPRQVNII